MAGSRSELYRLFWAKFLARVKVEYPSWTRATAPAQNWLWLTSPIRGCGISSVFGFKGKIRQKLYIDRPTAEQCLAVFNALLARRAEFETAYGRSMEWDSLDGRKSCRIYDLAEGEVQDETDHDKYIVTQVSDSGKP